MNITDDLSFDEWFQQMVEACRQQGYEGPIDKYSQEWSYEDGDTPEQAAFAFLTEINYRS